LTSLYNFPNREKEADLHTEMVEAEEERMKERDAAKKQNRAEAKKHEQKADQKEQKAKADSKE
jgi:uncharacterized protein (DUF3084 family)